MQQSLMSLFSEKFLDRDFLARIATLFVAGAATLGSLVLTALLILAHLANLKQVKQQLCIMLIVLMVPVFGLSSFVGLTNLSRDELFFTELDSIKECYEAVVIAAFLELMYSYLDLHASRGSTVPKALQGKTVHHTFPVSLFTGHERPLDRSTLWLLRWFTWQFVLLRPPLSLVILSLQANGAWNGPLGWVVTVILQVSIFFAMYSLIQFYHAFEDELKSHRILAKILSVKGIVFFAFWQGLVMNVLAFAGVIHGDRHFFYSVRQVEDALQNFLVCIEMLGFALVNFYAFSHHEYTKHGEEEVTKKEQ